MNQPITTETELTPKQQAFINALVDNGGKLEQAALTAGYSAKSARTVGYSNLRIPHVAAAYKALLWQKLQLGAAGAVLSLNKLALEAESEHARLSAANAILDRVGFKQQEQLTNAGGVSININFGKASDLAATKTIDATAQVIDSSANEVITQGDAVTD